MIQLILALINVLVIGISLTFSHCEVSAPLKSVFKRDGFNTVNESTEFGFCKYGTIPTSTFRRRDATIILKVVCSLIGKTGD